MSLVRKLFLAILILPLFFLTTVSVASAATKTVAKAKGPSLVASMAKNKRTVAVTFSNLTTVKSIKYKFTYNSNKGLQGASGTIKLAKNSKNLSRSLTLGTCSGRVCSYHTNIKNAKLSVDFILTSGGVISYDKKL